MKTRRIGALIGATTLALALGACGSSDDGTASGGSSGSAADGDSIKIGIKFDQPGLGLFDAGKYSGFDVDVANYVAKELGKTNVTFIQSPSKQREDLIATGQVDLIFATYSITDERKQKVSFAGPYFVAGQDLLVTTDSDITGPEGLDGKKLCSVTGSTSAQKVKDSYPGVQLQNFDTYSKCLDLVVNGQLDALTTDNTILAGYAAQPAYKGKLKVVGKTFSEERYGVGLKKGDVALCEKVNTALKKMVDSGEWQKAVDANFGPAGFKVDTATNPPKTDACS